MRVARAARPVRPMAPYDPAQVDGAAVPGGIVLLTRAPDGA